MRSFNRYLWWGSAEYPLTLKTIDTQVSQYQKYRYIESIEVAKVSKVSKFRNNLKYEIYQK